ncbi:hypothetical protein [Vallitalea sp.]|jgi:hypothetical protein|uniref:hypothetical protein n=1 Tax=Vallitalea sp. TaxID=1882829 RepID=UPI0025E7EFA1|nr:hypothetical protein [Vallitalea sp.]MCT4688377.1 hypothetical protein [Vallitalea sp.]
MIFNNNLKKLLSFILAFAIVISITNNSYAKVPLTNKDFITAEELVFEENVKTDEYSSFELKTEYMQEDKTVYNWKVNDDTSSITLVMKGIQNNVETYSQEFLIYLDEIKSFNPNINLTTINNNDIIEYIKHLYSENYSTNIDLTYNNKDISDVTNESSLDKYDMVDGSYVLQPIFNTYLFAGAFGAALLSFLTANWAIIVAVLVIAVVVITTAYMLYNYLKKTCTDTEDMHETVSLHKHIALEDVREIRRPQNKLAAYYSPSCNNMLVVYRVPIGFKATLNGLMSADSRFTREYTLKDYDIGAFKLLVLYDFKTNKIFHAEVRFGLFANKAIEKFRYYNSMIQQIYPEQKIDLKYNNPCPNEYKHVSDIQINK